MGYTTTFRGAFEINPPLSSPQIEKMRAWFENPPAITRWSHRCDWEVSDEGDAIFWNGCEKSYDMHEWIVCIYLELLKPNKHTLSGTVYAFGEEPNDQWKMVANVNDAGKCTITRHNRPIDW